MSKTFIYNEHHGITFHPSTENRSTMVNATDMAKAFNRRPNDFLQLDSTKRFINAFESDTRNNGITLTHTIKGKHRSGVKQGTWFHEDLALKFAAWLNPYFEVWMIKHIKELLQKGATSITDVSRKELALMIVRAEEEKENLLNQNNTLSHQLEEQKPKIVLAESIETSKNTILIGHLARILKQNDINIGQNRLFNWMRENGYLLSKGDLYNKPSQRAMDLKLFEVQENTISVPGKDPRISFTTKITGKGQTYFINKFLNPNNTQAS